MEVGKKLRFILDDYDMPQYKLAKQIGVCPATMCRWIRGSRFPNACHLLILAKHYPKVFSSDEVIKCISKK